MAEKKTLARPYAKAAFQHSLETNSTDKWSTMLNAIAELVQDKRVKNIISNPTIPSDKRASLFTGQTKLFDEDFNNFIRLVAKNKRLELFPEIANRFDDILHNYNNELNVFVESAIELDSNQKQSVEKALAKKIGKKLNLIFNINESLIGGLVIKAGDMVIDASVTGQLKKMASKLIN